MKNIIMLLLLLPMFAVAQVERFGTVSTKKVESYNANLTIKANAHKIVEDAFSGIDWLIAGSTKMVMDSAGKVGIGVTPSYKLEVGGEIHSRGFGSEGGQVSLNNTTNTASTMVMDVDSGNHGRLFTTVNNTNITIGQLGGTGGVLAFYTAAAERMRIDSAGNVGIGTTPAAFFHVNGYQRLAGALDVKYHSNIAAHTGLALGTAAKATPPSGGQGKIGIYSDDASNQLEGSIALITSATASNRRLKIEAIEQGVAYRDVTLAEGGGNVSIGVIPSARNNTTLQIKDGIGFPAAQVASTDANTLDDYEEGTFTPTITAGSGSFTTVSGIGRYTKIGRKVFAVVSVTITTNGTAAGYVRITNLPFASIGETTVGAGRELNVTGSMLQCNNGGGGTLLDIMKYDNTYPGGSGYKLNCSITYETN